MPHYTIPVRIDARELKRLEEYEQQKDMAVSSETSSACCGAVHDERQVLR